MSADVSRLSCRCVSRSVITGVATGLGRRPRELPLAATGASGTSRESAPCRKRKRKPAAHLTMRFQSGSTTRLADAVTIRLKAGEGSCRSKAPLWSLQSLSHLQASPWFCGGPNTRRAICTRISGCRLNRISGCSLGKACSCAPAPTSRASLAREGRWARLALSLSKSAYRASDSTGCSLQLQ